MCLFYYIYIYVRIYIFFPRSLSIELVILLVVQGTTQTARVTSQAGIRQSILSLGRSPVLSRARVYHLSLGRSPVLSRARVYHLVWQSISTCSVSKSHWISKIGRVLHVTQTSLPEEQFSYSA